MELIKIGIDFKDIRENQIKQHISADVVVIDRTTSDVHPMLYMLKNARDLDENDREAIKSGCLIIDRDAFIQVGEVLMVDKRKKHIILVNQNTLSYKRLIIASGTQNTLISYEFLAGIQTLIDAIRVRKKIPSSFAKTHKEENKKNSRVKKTKSEPSPKVDSVSNSNIKPTSTDSYRNLNLAGTHKRLYEVQI
jgi:NADH dehydrogenase FAD-containing subunit